MKQLLTLVNLLLIFGVCQSQVISNLNIPAKQLPDTIILPDPSAQQGKPLMQALKERKTTRTLSDEKLSPEQLSGLLWAANGINRPDGKRTTPAAVNVQFVDIYVVLEEGIFMYDAMHHRLVPIVAGDFRKNCGSQDFVGIAALNLVYVGDFSESKKLPEYAANADENTKLQWAYINAGAQSQNVSLYCASEGLGTVVRTSINGESFGKIMGCTASQKILLSQTVGVPK